MKRSSIIGTILLILLTLVPAASALVAVARTRQVLSAGGALVSNGGITIASTVGQPIAGSSTAGGVKLGHGFWGPHFGGFSVHLPLMLRNYVLSSPYFEGPWEAEPNNSSGQANGPLRSDREYLGTFPSLADEKDYYYIYLMSTRSVELWLTHIPAGNDYDLALRDAALNEVKKSQNQGQADEHIFVDILPTGLYYIQVYNYSHDAIPQILWIP